MAHTTPVGQGYISTTPPQPEDTTEYLRFAEDPVPVPGMRAMTGISAGRHQWVFLQFASAQTKLGTKVDLALFADAAAERPELVAVPVGPAIEAGLRSTIGIIEG